MKILLDTNALLDLVAPRPPFDADIRKLCIASVFGDVQLWVSTQSFADAYYILRKNADSAAVKGALLQTLQLVHPCGTYGADLRAALESDWSDVEDFLIASAAKRIPVDYLVTRDEELLARSPVKAITARDLLAQLEEQGLVYDEVEF